MLKMKALEQLKNNLDQENQAMNNHWRQIQIYLGKKKRAIQNDSTPNKTRNERLRSLGPGNRKPKQEII